MDGEIIARVERRRQWTPQEKAALLAEVEASGGQVSVVARRHGISKSLLNPTGPPLAGVTQPATLSSANATAASRPGSAATAGAASIGSPGVSPGAPQEAPPASNAPPGATGSGPATPEAAPATRR